MVAMMPSSFLFSDTFSSLSPQREVLLRGVMILRWDKVLALRGCRYTYVTTVCSVLMLDIMLLYIMYYI